MINRDDMLELTRRMTPSRTCFDRIAGAYINDLGEIDESFNIHFGKLSGSEQKRNLQLAKTIPFAKTNEQLKEYAFSEKAKGKVSTAIKILNKSVSILTITYEWENNYLSWKTI